MCTYLLIQEHIRAEGELDRLLQLLGELKDSNSWFDGCSRVILYCIQYNLSRYAVTGSVYLFLNDTFIAFVLMLLFSQSVLLLSYLSSSKRKINPVHILLSIRFGFEFFLYFS